MAPIEDEKRDDPDMTIPSWKRTVFLLHGVDSKGLWYTWVSKALQPHLHCVGVRYERYQHLGKLKIMFRPLWFGVGLVMIIVCPFAKHFSDLLGSPELLAAGVFSVIASRWLSHCDRIATERIVAVQVNEQLRVGFRPNIVAHSFGTALAGQLFERFQIEFSGVCLAGSVLPRRFDWASLVKGSRERVQRVRNDVAPADSVVKLAGMLTTLGTSGIDGFDEVPGIVHSPSKRPCHDCEQAHAPVHNFRFPFRHNDHFVGTNHTLREYLPFFLDVEPVEFALFTELCRAGAVALESRDSAAVASVELRFRSQHWKWAKSTIDGYINESLFLRRNSTLFLVEESTTAKVIRGMWILVDHAWAAIERGEHDACSLSVRPRFAAQRAMEGV